MLDNEAHGFILDGIKDIKLDVRELRGEMKEVQVDVAVIKSKVNRKRIPSISERPLLYFLLLSFVTGSSGVAISRPDIVKVFLRFFGIQ